MGIFKRKSKKAKAKARKMRLFVMKGDKAKKDFALNQKAVYQADAGRETRRNSALK